MTQSHAPRLFWSSPKSILAIVIFVAGLSWFWFYPRFTFSTSPGEKVPSQIQAPQSHAVSDSNAVATADLSVLMVGNSHTTFHDLHRQVARCLEHCLPGKKVVTAAIGVTSLNEAPQNPALRDELSRRQWDVVILQAQPISQSGKYRYSKQGALEVARLAQARGARVLFFSEWGLQGNPANTAHTEEIYRELAEETQTQLIPVGRVWEQALARDPTLPLYEQDGNHESPLGAQLTAGAITVALLQDQANNLANYSPPKASAQQWAVMVDAIRTTGESPSAAGTGR